MKMLGGKSYSHLLEALALALALAPVPLNRSERRRRHPFCHYYYCDTARIRRRACHCP